MINASYPKILLAILAALLATVPASDSAARQTEEVRAAELEEKAKKAAQPEQGLATILLSIRTVDGVPPGVVLAKLSSARQYKNSTSRSTSYRTLRPKLVHELRPNSGAITLYLHQPGYSVCEVFHETEIAADAEIVKTAILIPGVERTVKVLDDQGKPLQGAKLWVRVRGTTASQPSVTDENGIATVNLSPDREDETILVGKSTWVSKTIDKPLAEEAFELKLARRPATTIKILDDQGNPLAGARVWKGAKSDSRSPSGTLWDLQDTKPIDVTDGNGMLQTRTISGRFHTLVVESDKHRGVIGGVEEGKEHSLKLSPLKPVQIRFKGMPKDELANLLKQVNLKQRYSNHCQIILQWTMSEDGLSILTNAVEGRELTLTHFDFSTLYENENYSHDSEEIVIDLESLKRPEREIIVVFENSGVPVEPKGKIRIRTQDRSGVWSSGKVVSIEQGEAAFYNKANKFIVESEGLTGYAIVKREKFTCAKRDGKETVVVPVEPAGAIVGSIVDADGKNISTQLQCSYTFIDRKRSLYAQFVETISNKKGKYVLSPIPLGTKATINIGSYLSKEKKTVTIDEENPVAELDLVLPKTDSATLIAKFENGKPASGVSVQIVRLESTTSSQSTDTDGKAVFPGLLVDKDQYTARLAPKTDFQLSKPKKILAGETVEFIVRRGHKLAGVVVDEEGNPVPELVVKAFFDGQFVAADGRTDKEGKFLFTRLPKQEVKLVAAHRWEPLKSEASDPLMPDEAEPVKLVVK